MWTTPVTVHLFEFTLPRKKSRTYTKMSDASLEKDATKLLVFYRQSEYVHESTGRMVETLQELGELNHWCVETSEDSAVFSDLETLMAFDVVVFAHTSGDLLLDEPQQRNLQQFLSNHKKGFMGIHSAAATMMGLSVRLNHLG